jgi:hypothetical protein
VVLAVNPLLLYGSILIVPVAISIGLRFVIVVPKRECIQCGRTVAVTAFSCRHCGYRYTAEDRALMRRVAERRKRDYATRR